MSARDHLLSVRYDEGAGPVIVLLHGINADAKDWRVVIDRIGPGYRCIAPDLLGFGESPKPLELDYSADDHANALDATLESLGISEPFLLVGYSLGGDIAVRYASTWPSKIRRLFLLSTPFYLPSGAYTARGFSGDYAQAQLFQWVWNWVARGKESDTLAYQIATGRAEELAQGFLRTGDVELHWEVMGRSLRNTIAAATLVDDLPALDMPVTFALGIKDPIVRPDQTPALKRLKPDLEVRRIVGMSADHFMLLNLPETVADEIMRDEIRELAPAFMLGTGEPVVLLHGLLSGAEGWRAAATALAERHEVVALDLLGFGRSAAPAALRYTLADHATAVLNTIRARYGDRPVVLVGYGLGANVALAAAADDPARVSRVVAFQPLLLPAGMTPEQVVTSRPAAEALSAREAYRELATSVRAPVAAERLERDAVPFVRSLENAIIGVDSAALLARVSVPTRIVIPADYDVDNASWLAEQSALHGFELIGPADGPNPTTTPGPAARAIDPDLSEQAVARADGARRKRRSMTGSLLDIVTAADNAQALRAMLSVLGGVVLLLLPTLVPSPIGRQALVLLVAGGWVLVEGASTVLGAIGLARARKAWVSFFLLGALTVAVGFLMFVRPDFGLLLVALYVMARSIGLGVASLWAARNVTDPAASRRTLWFEATAGIGVGAAILLVPELGADLLRVVLGWYLVVTGAATAGYVLAEKRRSLRRVRELLAD